MLRQMLKAMKLCSLILTKWVLIINYNMDPIVPGAGSAIFMHLHQAPNKPTAGCITMDETHLLILLKWLNKAQHPYIFIS